MNTTQIMRPMRTTLILFGLRTFKTCTRSLVERDATQPAISTKAALSRDRSLERYSQLRRPEGISELHTLITADHPPISTARTPLGQSRSPGGSLHFHRTG